MCGRYRLSRCAEILASYFHAEYEGMYWEARYNIAPTQTVPVIRQDLREPVRRYHAAGGTATGIRSHPSTIGEEPWLPVVVRKYSV